MAAKLRAREDRETKFETVLEQEHTRMTQEVSATIAAISKLLPTSEREFDEYEVLPQSSKQVEPDESRLTQALELNAAEGELSRRIDVKNESLGMIDVTNAFSRYHRHLVHLDLSMNKITSV